MGNKGIKDLEAGAAEFVAAGEELELPLDVEADAALLQSKGPTRDWDLMRKMIQGQLQVTKLACFTVFMNYVTV